MVITNAASGDENLNVRNHQQNLVEPGNVKLVPQGFATIILNKQHELDCTKPGPGVLQKAPCKAIPRSFSMVMLKRYLQALGFRRRSVLIPKNRSTMATNHLNHRRDRIPGRQEYMLHRGFGFVVLPLLPCRSAAGSSDLLLPPMNIGSCWLIECYKDNPLEVLILEAYEPAKSSSRLHKLPKKVEPSPVIASVHPVPWTCKRSEGVDLTTSLGHLSLDFDPQFGLCCSVAAEAPMNVQTSSFSSLAPSKKGRHFLVMCCLNKAIFLDSVTMHGRDVPKQELDNKFLLCRTGVGDGPLVAFGASNGIIRVLSMMTWKLVRRYTGGHKRSISCLMYFMIASSEALLVLGASDGLFITWSTDQRQDTCELVPKLSLKAPEGGVVAVELSRVIGGAAAYKARSQTGLSQHGFLVPSLSSKP
ncbi:hypothetical protein VNO77_41839 [Canavalia gladiata]|uniref:Uncharacterized protein n=1 Tax=Canavalia gladiata TaxID=3824 RepID=A0AAN9PSB8_CANGL